MKNRILNVLLFIGLLWFAPLTQAQLVEENSFFAYNYWGRQNILDYLKLVDQHAEANSIDPAASPKCQVFHDRYTKDGIVDIRYDFGYFDDTTGSTVEWDGKNWGLSPSADEGMFRAVREVLKEPCQDLSRRLCGFKELTSDEDRNSDGRTVMVRNMIIQGKSVEVRITLTQASASYDYKANLTSLHDRQSHLTQISESEFFGGLREADYVFYNGHSRNGGGPDFNPPRLDGIKHVNYKGYYQKVRPGITRLISELKKGTRKDVMLGLFSCDSRLHFEKRLIANNPKQSVILTANKPDAVLDYYDTLKASAGYLEGLLRGGCGPALDQFARVEPKIQKTFVSYHLQ
jgi:hypothetical protein